MYSKLDEVLRDASINETFSCPEKLISSRRSATLFYIEVVQSLFSEIGDFESWLNSLDNVTKESVIDSPVIRAAVNQLLHSSKGFSDLKDFACAVLIATRILGASPQNQEFFEVRALTGMLRFVSPPHLELTQKSLLSQLFENQVGQHFAKEELEIISPDDETVDVIVNAVNLLDELVPELLSTALPHVKAFAIADRRAGQANLKDDDLSNFQAASSIDVPGCIFLTTTLKSSPWRAAETVYHEAIHQKMFDIMSTREIYRPGYISETSNKISAPWNRNESGSVKLWSTDRALFACHVYVYMSVYYLSLSERVSSSVFKKYGNMDCEVAFMRVAERASHLLSELSSIGRPELGRAGVKFLEWLTSLQLKCSSMAMSTVR